MIKTVLQRLPFLQRKTRSGIRRRSAKDRLLVLGAQFDSSGGEQIAHLSRKKEISTVVQEEERERANLGVVPRRRHP